MSRNRIVDYERQERLIEEKRKVFLAKKAGLIHLVPTLARIDVTEDNSKPKQTESSEKFPFANDGSFFAQFLQMKPPPSPEPPAPPVPPTHFSPHQQHNITFINTPPTDTPQPPPPLPTAPPTDTILPPPPPVKLSLAPIPHPDQPLTAPVSGIFTEENHGSNHSRREDKVSEFELAERMAQQLALATDQAIKKFQSEQDQEGPLYFLRDSTHPANVYFIQKWLEYRHTNKSKPSNEHIPPPVSADSTPRRKSRWSDENDTVKVPPHNIYPSNPISPSESSDQKKQIEVQRVLDRIAETIRARGRGRGRGRGVKRFIGTRYEYDSDEENDFGTWEHKRRALEMEKTRESAEALTELGKGKHHLSDFLPDDEYLKFMTEVEQVRQGEELKPETSDYQDNEIKEDNIGYRMLQRAGWHEGQGLGAQQQGIVAPVNKGRSSLDSTGVGSGNFQSVGSDDDEFSLYRKRMMLAYKFRPNPLNNPRRPYYD